MMKKYWFLLDAYVFLWENGKQALIYNTLSQKGFIYTLTPLIEKILKELENKENLYGIELSEKQLQEKEIQKFVQIIRDNFCGDLIDQELCPHKPAIFIPEPNINDDLERQQDFSYNIKVFGNHIIRNLTDITIELTGNCDQACKDCENIYQQFAWCRKSREILSQDLLIKFLSQLKYTYIFDLHLIGGDIFTYPYWEHLKKHIEFLTCKINFYIHYSCLSGEKATLLEAFTKDKKYFFHLFIDSPLHLKENFINSVLPEEQIIYRIKISNPEEYEILLKWMEVNPGKQIKVFPYYNGENKTFFEEYVYQDQEEILSTGWKKNEIFAHQFVNTNDFGKLTLRTDGKLYANPNFEPVGNWDEELKIVIYNELREGNSWRRTRDTLKECKECLCKYICPSPSNYELVIKKNNLCHVEK